ncbi:MAG: hypothetical protein Q7U05_16100 [Polaromonas sp.]|nr:hypothetical protein [Polaromonas sp.]
MPSIENQLSQPPCDAKPLIPLLSRQLLVLLSALLLCGAALAERSDGPSGGRHDNDSGKGGKHSPGSDRQGLEVHGTDLRDADRRGQDRRDEARQSRDRSGPDRQGQAHAGSRAGSYFQERQRSAVHDYYGNEYRTGRCPPGLSRKHNGCMPPGQVRYYSVGQRLAPAVIYHTVPAAIVVTLGVPPSGHRYVRVASDILLIAIGTGLVVDAIQDLGGM